MRRKRKMKNDEAKLDWLSAIDDDPRFEEYGKAIRDFFDERIREAVKRAEEEELTRMRGMEFGEFLTLLRPEAAIKAIDEGGSRELAFGMAGDKGQFAHLMGAKVVDVMPGPLGMEVLVAEMGKNGK